MRRGPFNLIFDKSLDRKTVEIMLTSEGVRSDASMVMFRLSSTYPNNIVISIRSPNGVFNHYLQEVMPYNEKAEEILYGKEDEKSAQYEEAQIIKPLAYEKPAFTFVSYDKIEALKSKVNFSIRDLDKNPLKDDEKIQFHKDLIKLARREYFFKEFKVFVPLLFQKSYPRLKLAAKEYEFETSFCLFYEMQPPENWVKNSQRFLLLKDNNPRKQESESTHKNVEAPEGPHVPTL